VKSLFFVLLVVFGDVRAQYEPGTLEALNYLNDQWVEKPRQRAHERELMRIKSQGYQGQGGGFNAFNEPVCISQPVYGHGGVVMGYRQSCY
jgi:hypothetical protein